MKYKVLIVEDEPEIANLISNRLDPKSYEVKVIHDGKAALSEINSTYYDLVSLDIMLPYVDGMVLCETVRKRNKNSLITIISALDMEDLKEKAYILGADDYIPKPFSPKLVALKFDTLLKRRFEMIHSQLSFYNNITHDKELRRFYIGEAPLTLTLSEYKILESLFHTPKKVFSKEELSQILYDNDIGTIDKEGIGTHIYQLRKKIAQLCDKEIIKTIRGIGYTLYEN